jgi:hypothetical protein
LYIVKYIGQNKLFVSPKLDQLDPAGLPLPSPKFTWADDELYTIDSIPKIEQPRMECKAARDTVENPALALARW